MNKTKHEILMPLIEILMSGTLFLALAVILCYEPLGFAMQDYWRCIVLAYAAAAWMWLLRHVKMSNRRFYIGHIVLAVAVILFGRNDNESFIYFVIAFVMINYSSFVMFKTQRSDRERPSYAFLLVMAAAYISGAVYGYAVVQNTAIAAAAGFVLLSVAHKNMFALKQVTAENVSTVNFPLSQITRVNKWILAATVILMAAAMLIALAAGGGRFGFLGDAAIVVGRYVAIFIIWLIEMLGKLTKSSSSGGQTAEDDGGDDILSYMTADNENGDIEKIINAAIIVVAVIIVIFAIIAVIKTVNAFMQGHKTVTEGRDEIEFIKKDVKKIRIVHTDRREQDSAASIDEQYRRLYKKAVRRTMKKTGKKSLPASMTPSDITLENITRDEKQAQDVTRAYETARYSPESVSKQDIDRIKKAHT